MRDAGWGMNRRAGYLRWDHAALPHTSCWARDGITYSTW